MKKLQYSIHIDKPQEFVFNQLIDKSTYNDWAKAFSPGSTYDGEFAQGHDIRFTDPGLGGTVAHLEVFEPHSRILAKHIAMIGKDGSQTTEGEMAEKWIGTVEEYTFVKEEDDTTTLNIEMQTDEAFQKMFDSSWPKALELFKALCDSK